MLTNKDVVRISKFLSLALRHQPEFAGLTLEENGWANIAELLPKLKANGMMVSEEDLQLLVRTNSKQRFAFDESGTKIRASQGHSVKVAIDFAKADPPTVLHHGTAVKNVAAILQDGLIKQSRHHVHLSTNLDTALTVGKRHGEAVVLEVAAEKMRGDGHQFYLSANGVWLVDFVPASYLNLLSTQ